MFHIHIICLDAPVIVKVIPRSPANHINEDTFEYPPLRQSCRSIIDFRSFCCVKEICAVAIPAYQNTAITISCDHCLAQPLTNDKILKAGIMATEERFCELMHVQGLPDRFLRPRMQTSSICQRLKFAKNRPHIHCVIENCASPVA